MLAQALGCAGPAAAPITVRLAVLGALRRRRRWLLVFDNALGPQDIAEWLPGGGGHGLVTSRAAGGKNWRCRSRWEYSWR